MSCVFELMVCNTSSHMSLWQWAIWIPPGCLGFIKQYGKQLTSKAAWISCAELEEASLVSYDLLD